MQGKQKVEEENLSFEFQSEKMDENVQIDFMKTDFLKFVHNTTLLLLNLVVLKYERGYWTEPLQDPSKTLMELLWKISLMLKIKLGRFTLTPLNCP